MPRKKKRASRAKPAEQHTHVAVSIDSYDVRARADINRYAYEPQYAWRDTEDEPLYEFETNLEIKGTCMHPKDRAGDAVELTVYSEDSPESHLYWKLRDIQAVDDHHTRKYREYRGKRTPIYEPPQGIGHFEKTRGESRWHGSIFVQPRFVTDLLIVLRDKRQLFLEIHESKIKRHRRIRALTVQTTDPAEE